MNTCSLEKYVIPNFCCRMQLESEQAHIDTNCVCVCVLTIYITLTQAIVQDNFSLAEIDCYNSCMVDAGAHFASENKLHVHTLQIESK